MFDSLSPSFGPSPLQRTGATTALLTSRSPVPRTGSPFQASGEISPGKNAVLRRTTAEFTPPGPWPSRLRSLLPARPARRRLVSGSCPSACGLRYRLPSYARSPLRSCRSLRFRWPDYGRTCTSKTAPMLGAQQKGGIGCPLISFSNHSADRFHSGFSSVQVRPRGLRGSRLT